MPGPSASGLLIAGTTALNAWLIKDIINKVFFDRDATMLWVLTAVIVTIGFVRGYSLYASSVTLGGSATPSWRASRAASSTICSISASTSTIARRPATWSPRMSHNATAARQVLDTVINPPVAISCR